MSHIILQDLLAKYSEPLICVDIAEALDIMISEEYTNGQIIDLKLNMVYQYDQDLELMVEKPIERAVK